MWGRRRAWGLVWIGVVCALGLVAQPAAAAPPVAQFSMSPEVAQVGQTVTFTDTSFDPDGVVVQRGWDLNADSIIGDPFGPRVIRRAYEQPGPVAIMLRVTDNSGEVSETTRVLQVVAGSPTPPPNKPPTASFSYAPQSPEVGAAVTLTSTSTDAEGFLASELWDLDGDGQFDDAGGHSVQAAFVSPGPRTVSLQVTDDDGASAIAFQTIEVRGADAAQAPAVVVSTPTTTVPGAGTRRPISPFPVVRIRGTILANAVRVQLFTVRAPATARVRIVCRGRSCPYARKARLSTSSLIPLRFRGLERRLGSGTVIEVFVTQPKRMGKYTRFRIRAGQPPARTDLCVATATARPQACASG